MTPNALTLAALAVGILLAVSAGGQEFKANYDEDRVPEYTLPDPLAPGADDKKIGPKRWRKRRRGEILDLFREHVYGRAPGRPDAMTFEVFDVDENALDGLATRKQVEVRPTGDRDDLHIDVLTYLPNDAKGPVPTFLTLNFFGNHSIHADPGIRMSQSWLRDNDDYGVVDNRPTEKSRGVRSSRWAVEMILERGYGLATIYYGDIDPDFHDGFQNGAHPLFYADGQTEPKPDEWGSIAAWAWGLSRALDYLETDEEVDHKRVAVMGHSRLGKTSLWAGAEDERFAMVISNDSGCGGAALARRAVGETVGRINTSFPHWFCGNHRQYNENEAALPVDQHELIALIAPRPVYVASAEGVCWADPRGVFLSCKHASPVYRMLGTEGLPADDMPAVDHPVQGQIGYHVRSGGHDVKDFDWEQYLSFADKHLR